jgi:cysteine sulfinate desulfinase/cysteine desulfurase-like protein
MVGSVVASHVLLAMGLSRDHAASAVRFSLGKQTTVGEIEREKDKRIILIIISVILSATLIVGTGMFSLFK